MKGTCPSFRSGKVVTAHLVLDPALQERSRLAHRRDQFLVPVLLHQISRVEPIGHHRHPKVEIEAKWRLQLVAPERGL